MAASLTPRRVAAAFADTSESLRAAISANPYMQVLVLNGYYDMATPYFATEYTFSHLELEPELRSNISMTYYEGGHMMYADEVCLAQMTADIEGFYSGLGAQRGGEQQAVCVRRSQ